MGRATRYPKAGFAESAFVRFETARSQTGNGVTHVQRIARAPQGATQAGEAAGLAKTAFAPVSLRTAEDLLEQLRAAKKRIAEQAAALLRVQQQLVAEKERYAELFDQTPDAVFVTDTLGVILEANRPAARLFGARPGYLIGKPLINYVALEERSRPRNALLAVSQRDAGLRVQTIDHLPITPPGAVHFDAKVRLTAAFKARSNGASQALVRWHIRDNSDSLNAEDAYHQLLVDAIAEFAIFMLDNEQRIVSWNRGAEEIFGYGTEEAIGRPYGDLFLEDDRRNGSPQLECAVATDQGRCNCERWQIRKGGSAFYTSGVLIRLPGSSRNRRFVKILRDTTEWKLSDERLQRYHDELERHVVNRTAELAETNEVLQREISEREQAETHRRQLLGTWVRALEEERRRISRELHDEMGQHLTAFTLGLKSLETRFSSDREAQQELQRLGDQVAELSRDMHRLAVELRPTVLEDLGLVIGLRSYIDAWSERSGIPVAFDISGMDQLRLSADAEIALYRITQEALTNVARHANASAVTVLLYRNDGYVILTVEDNGRGFEADRRVGALARKTPAKDSTDIGGLGLVGVRERVSFIGGAVEIESKPGQGATLIVRVPVSSQTEQP